MSYAALPVLRTPRLTLRPLTPLDADAIVDGVGNYDVSRWLGPVPYPYERSDAEWFINRVRDENRPVWGICDHEGLRGAVGIEEDFGYWLARPAWRKGYGFEAARAVVEHWFSDPANGALESGFFDDNARSGEILRAIGFVVSGGSRRFSKSLNQDVSSTEVVLTRARWEGRQGFALYTPRLTIRPMEVGDAAALAGMAMPELARQTGSVAAGWTLDEARDWIAERPWRGCPGFQLAVEREGRVIGALGFGATPLSVMYMLHPAQWGQGLASEALAAFLPELFERFSMTRVCATVFEDNPASRRIMKKFGFSETGRGTGHSKARLEPSPVITYAVTRETLRVPT